MAVLAIALVVAGAALASLGVLRLTRAAFIEMPLRVAASALAAGVAVVAFGALLPRFASQREMPEVTLERQPAGATPAPLPAMELRGIVRKAGGGVVGDADVTLYAGTNPPRKARSDASGRYTFGKLPPGAPYRVAVSYDGGMFQRVVLLPASDIAITVAPTTNKPAQMRVRAASLAVVGDARGVQAVYAATLENAGREAYIGGVPLPVLPGAMGVEPRAGIDRSQLGVQNGVLFSSAPILPGSTAISYTYVAPIREKGAEIFVDATFPTARFDLLIAGRLRADARGTQNGAVRLGGRTYHRYTWRELRAGREVGARIVPSSAAPLVRTGAIVAGGVLAAVIVVFPLLRRRRSVAVTSAPVAVRQ